MEDKRHRPMLLFIKKMMDVAAGYSKDDLIQFRSIASHDYRALVPLIEEYLRLAERSDTDVVSKHNLILPSKSDTKQPGRMHLFDLLREKRLFPSNNDLAAFAQKILTNVPSGRFGKISRPEIAAKIIEHLETLPEETRERLEASMRDALRHGSKKQTDTGSFLSKWEKIIKGIDL
jgi:hypothetical protein